MLKASQSLITFWAALTYRIGNPKYSYLSPCVLVCTFLAFDWYSFAFTSSWWACPTAPWLCATWYSMWSTISPCASAKWLACMCMCVSPDATVWTRTSFGCIVSSSSRSRVVCQQQHWLATSENLPLVLWIFSTHRGWVEWVSRVIGESYYLEQERVRERESDS